MERIIFVLSTFSVVLLLSSCASTDSRSYQHATCTTLKSQVVFSGATSNVRRAVIQNAEKPLRQANYDKENCG